MSLNLDGGILSSFGMECSVKVVGLVNLGAILSNLQYLNLYSWLLPADEANGLVVSPCINEM